MKTPTIVDLEGMQQYFALELRISRLYEDKSIHSGWEWVGKGRLGESERRGGFSTMFFAASRVICPRLESRQGVYPRFELFE
ncbi:MAG: hypothetical protein ACKVS8_10950 [Phycisphaerales bacterium]